MLCACGENGQDIACKLFAVTDQFFCALADGNVVHRAPVNTGDLRAVQGIRNAGAQSKTGEFRLYTQQILCDAAVHPSCCAGGGRAGCSQKDTYAPASRESQEELV